MLKQNKIYLGDNLELLKQLEDDSVHSCVSDFPYNLGFMGKNWDTITNYYDWCHQRAIELLRVLKPGGYCLIFGGTRTHHRLVCAFEDAGFEIKDELHWGYANGFPKNYDISKGFDKRKHGYLIQEEFKNYLNQKRIEKGLSLADINRYLDVATNGGGVASSIMGDKDNTTFPAKHQYEKLKKLLELDNRYDEIIEEEEREVIGQKTSGLGSGATYAFTDKNNFANNVVDITAPSTELAKQWDGWGTALKPSFEPIMMCQKPLEKGYCYNIEKHGIGGLNINGCRLDYKNNFPSNTILTDNILKEYNKFFMIPKPNKGDKTENGQINNNHPTIKPTELIRQLIKLITPENGLCIDICEGSGTHVKACLQLTNEGYLVNYMGFENDEDSYNTACEREKLNKVS